MTQQKDMPVEIISPPPRFRHWFTPPEFLTIKASDIEPLVPKENWKSPVSADLTVELPAEKIFSANVPRIPLRMLAELLPDHISSSDGFVILPAARLATAYHLVEHKEELPPEKLPEPEPPVIAEKPDLAATVPATILPAVAPPENFKMLPPIEPEGSLPQVPVSKVLEAAEEPDGKTRSADPIPTLPARTAGIAQNALPPRRSGPFAGLHFFRRKAVVADPTPPPATVVPEGLPAAEISAAPEVVVPEAFVPGPPPEDQPLEPVSPPVDEPARAPVLIVDPPPLQPVAVPTRMLQTEHIPEEEQGREIVEQEPLQSLFLTEETLSVNRVIELCCGLPGINSCVLAHGSIIVASHNVPDGVDLVSMSAHAADMLQAMRDSSARMGVGTVPAVTLHTEKGVISFFNREDLTLLVFHKDRGFVPGVREKMAAAIGELTKARLTLPVGGDEAL